MSYTPADITPWSGLITSEHSDKPKFMASLAAILQPIADTIATQCSMVGLFDFDNAVGRQLDIDGQWIGANRFILLPGGTVWFTWGDTAADGWGNPSTGVGGQWKGQYSPGTGGVATPLDDADYKTYLETTLQANHWDGTIPGAYAILAALAPGQTFYIADGGDMSMAIYLPATLTPVQAALLEENYLSIKPAGVRLNLYNQSSAPIFAWGSPTPASLFGGWNTGKWTMPVASY